MKKFNKVGIVILIEETRVLNTLKSGGLYHKLSVKGRQTKLDVEREA